MVAILRSPLHRIASSGLAVLSYTGRKVDFDRSEGLTDDQLARLGVEIALVRIDLDPVA